MKLNNVKTVTKKQAKAYAVIALDILGSTPNDIDVKMLDSEIDVAMRLYSPQEATEKGVITGGIVLAKKKQKKLKRKVD